MEEEIQKVIYANKECLLDATAGYEYASRSIIPARRDECCTIFRHASYFCREYKEEMFLNFKDSSIGSRDPFPLFSCYFLSDKTSFFPPIVSPLPVR